MSYHQMYSKDYLEALIAVEAAAKEISESIQQQLETHAGWVQFEFFSPELDMYWHLKLQKALAAVQAVDVNTDDPEDWQEGESPH